MATTPEGKVKRMVSETLKRFGVYYAMPVVSGYGPPLLDYIGCVRGQFFAIETKAPGGKPTARQWNTIRRMNDAGARVFIIDGPVGVRELEKFLYRNTCAEDIQEVEDTQE